MNRLARAIGLQNEGRLNEAETLFHEVIADDPAQWAAYYSLCVMALQRGDPASALLWSEQGLQQSHTPELYFAHGSCIQASGHLEDALTSYDKALEIKPDYIEVLINSGALLRQMLRHQDALERFNRVLTFAPEHTAALANTAILLTEFKQSEQAIALFERLLRIDPDYDFGKGLLCFERLHIGDWNQFYPLAEDILSGVRAGKKVCKTLAFMDLADSAEDHLKAARIFANHYCPRHAPLWQGEAYSHDRIRVAYVSPDLREHPVGHLLVGVIEHHDKNRFEPIAISLGIEDGSRIRERMRAAFDRFIDARLMGSEAIARLLREMEVDIAVDLAGYTADSRTEVFAYRPAPVQINFLGYAGTLGTDYMDYILADAQVIPPQLKCYYSEQALYLPHCYLPTDNSLRIAEDTPSRQDFGLPETGFVFCSFSHAHKINPPLFDVWMRLLAQVPGSVLWLAAQNEITQRNLRRETQARGIDPQRLIFAGRLPSVEQHLARYRQADLFLDTYPYNAHTTAADALMAGLPLVTARGTAFPSRVASSLLHAIGMEDLVTDSLGDYEAKALQIATSPVLLSELKARLQANRLTYPLFDTAAYCRDLETAYVSALRNHQKPNHPQALSEEPLASGTTTSSLDLGCGNRPKNPFNAGELHGIDVRENLAANIKQADLVLEPIPFADERFEYVTAHDFLEHVPRVIYVPQRRNAFVELMNEVYRVLKPGGLFLSLTPAYPHAEAFQDPTHVNIITEMTFLAYFDNVNRWAAAYGFKGAFLVRLQEWRGHHLLTVLQKVPLNP